MKRPSVDRQSPPNSSGATGEGTFFRHVWESVQDGITILGPDFTILGVNPVMEAWYPDHAPLVGKKCYQACRNRRRPCEDCPLVCCLERGEMERGVIPGPPSSEAEWLELSAYPVKDKAGKVERIVMFARDVTERTKAETELLESERRSKALLNALPDLLFEFDAAGKILAYTGQQEDLYATPSKFVGRAVEEVLPPSLARRAQEAIGRTLMTGEVQQFEYHLPIRGKDRFFEARLAPSGKDTVLALVRDITKRKQAEANLAQLNDLLRLINKIMRHDILNDLQIARSAMDLYEDLADDALYRKAMGRMEQGIALIKRMRELESLLMAGGILQPYSLRQAVREVAGRHTIDCTVEGNCAVLADDALYSVIDNLFINAVEHGKATAMKVDIRCREATCEVCFADNGTGVPPHIRNRIFDERFSYGESGGTGLGLYIAKRTVERYGGTIEVRDNHPQGAAFVLTLPASGHPQK